MFQMRTKMYVRLTWEDGECVRVNSPRGFDGAAALAFVCISHPCALAVLVVYAVSAKTTRGLSQPFIPASTQFDPDRWMAYPTVVCTMAVHV